MATTLNPYIAGTATAQTPFVGRADAMDAVRRLAQDPHGSGLVLLGPRTIGKTSLLRHLAAVLPGEIGTRTVYFDLSDKSTQSLGSILLSLAGAIATRLNLPAPDLGFEAERNFRSQWLPSVLAGLPPATQLTLLFDEPDQPARDAESGASAFYPYLKGLLERPPHRVRAMVATGRRMEDHAELANGALQALFRTWPVHRLSTLPSREAAQLIRLSEANQTLRWPAVAQARVEHFTGGHPQLTRLLCSQVWERVCGASHDSIPSVKVSDVDAAVPGVLDSANATLEALWNGMQPGAQVMASTLAATGSAPLSPAEIDLQLKESGVPPSVPGLAEARAHLHDWDVLEQTHGESHFRIELFRRWIAARRHLPQVLEELGFAATAAQQCFVDAQNFHRRGDLEQAAQAVRQALTLDTDHPRAAMLLAGVLLEQGHPAQAVEALEPLFDKHYSFMRPRMVHALNDLAQQTKDEAARMAILDRILELDPTNLEAARTRQGLWLEHGYHARKTGRLEEAREAFRKAGHEDLANEVAREIRFRELEQRMEPVLELEDAERYPEELEAVRRLAAEFGDLQDWGPELERIRRLMRLEELYARGIEALETGHAWQAVSLFRQVLELRSPYKKAEDYLELALRAAGETVEPRASLAGLTDEEAEGHLPPPFPHLPHAGGTVPPAPGPSVHGEGDDRSHRRTAAAVDAHDPPGGREGAAHAPERSAHAEIPHGHEGPPHDGAAHDHEGTPHAHEGTPHAHERKSHAHEGRPHALEGTSHAHESAGGGRFPAVAEQTPAEESADEEESDAARDPAKPARSARRGWWTWAAAVLMMNLAPLAWWLTSPPSRDTASAQPPSQTLDADLKHIETGNGSSLATPEQLQGPRNPPAEKPAPTGLAALPLPEEGGPTASSPRGSPSPEAVAGLRAECQHGKARSCFSLAWMYRNGNLLDRDDARAAALFRKACDAGDAASCNDLAMQYQAGAGVIGDPATALELYKKGCDLRDRNACKNLATLYYNGWGADRNVARAMSLFQKACDLDSFEGCNSLGALYDHGEGAPRDVKRAVALFKSACEGGYVLGCQNLGIQYEYGKGVARDLEQALTLYDQACNAGRKDACGFATQLRSGALNSSGEIHTP